MGKLKRQMGEEALGGERHTFVQVIYIDKYFISNNMII